MNLLCRPCENDSEEKIWVMEQSYLPSMLETNSYDTICQEHLEFYCLAQIQWLIEKAGMKIIDVCRNKVNGGSFQVIIAKSKSNFTVTNNVEELLKWEKVCGFDTMYPFKELKNNIELHKKQLLQFLKEEKLKGKIILEYGASTKGNVLLQYCGITSEYITAIAEVNKDKYGCVTPGTNIPIVSEREARDLHPDYAIVAGVPAKIIKYRYLPKEIESLNKIAWWDWTDEEIRREKNIFFI